jgi:hypothetical protein
MRGYECRRPPGATVLALWAQSVVSAGGKTGEIQRRRAGQRLGRLRWLLPRRWGPDAEKSSLSSARSRAAGEGRGVV